WSSDVCSSDLLCAYQMTQFRHAEALVGAFADDVLDDVIGARCCITQVGNGAAADGVLAVAEVAVGLEKVVTFGNQFWVVVIFDWRQFRIVLTFHGHNVAFAVQTEVPESAFTLCGAYDI